MIEIMSDRELDSELTTRLQKIEAQLEQLTQLLTLPKQVSRLEESLMLSTDFYRYQKLRDLLAAGEFKEADWETIRILMDLAGVMDIEEITPDDVRQYSCNDLRVLDGLWLKYSNSRFGFSVQLQIYQKVGGTRETLIEQDREMIIEMGRCVGWWAGDRWKKCDQLDYSLSAPVGCHPSRWWNSSFGSKMTNYFLSRLMDCQL